MLRLTKSLAAIGMANPLSLAQWQVISLMHDARKIRIYLSMFQRHVVPLMRNHHVPMM